MKEFTPKSAATWHACARRRAAATEMLHSVAPELRFDAAHNYTPTRLRVLWIENTLDCRTWTYYCDLRDAMARLHDLCIPMGRTTCVDGKRGFVPQVAVVGPRYMANVAHADETVGFSRALYPRLPLAIVQNKMYEATTKEIVGHSDSKLRWARDAGAVVAFTWLSQWRDFTRRSGIPHHFLPFGVDAALYGKYAASLAAGATQPIEVGFTGASSIKYPLRHAILQLVKSMNVTSYLGTWQQTGLRTTHNDSWKALDRDGYVQQISRTKMWVSTSGPSDIIGTRYYEVLASGTTLLLCNRLPPDRAVAYDGLFQDGVHAVFFDGMEDLRAKILYYARHEKERRTIVDKAAALVRRVHTWDARARFLSQAMERAVRGHTPPDAPYYSGPPPEVAAAIAATPYVGCFGVRTALQGFTEMRVKGPLRRYTVATCSRACGRHRLFAMLCGGFCSGNGHRLGRCFCATGATGFGGGDGGAAISAAASEARRKPSECETTCSLHDMRPCGGYDAAAVFAQNATTKVESPEEIQTRRATSKPRKQKPKRGAARRRGAGVAPGAAARNAPNGR